MKNIITLTTKQATTNQQKKPTSPDPHDGHFKHHGHIKKAKYAKKDKHAQSVPSKNY